MSDIEDYDNEPWVDLDDDLDVDVEDDEEELGEDADEEDEVDEDQDEELEEYEVDDENCKIILHNTFIHLTKYERTKILGLRAKQIEMGAKPVIKYSTKETPLEIAERELIMKKIPFKIKRNLPSGEVEIIKLRNLC